MALGRQAKTLSEAQVRTALRHLETTRRPERDRVIVLLSLKAGLRAKEIASLTWPMVTDPQGNVGDVIALEDKAAKGRNGGRQVPLNRDLKAALEALRATAPRKPGDYVITTERAERATADTITKWFQRLYADLGFEGCSSHSGRRTFITRAARKVSEVGGSLRDVQQLAGHASLQTTQGYVEGDSQAKRKLVDLI